MARLSVAALVVGFAVVACQKAERTYSEAELETLRAHLRLDADPRCTAASTHTLAFSEPTGELEQCAKDVSRLSAAIKPFTPFDPHSDLLVPVADGRCGQLLEESVARIAALGDACSPYQVGMRPVPEPPMATLNFTKTLAVRARLLSERGMHAEALALSMNMLEVAQALSRGNTELIPVMISGSASWMTLRIAPELVERAPRTPDNLRAVLDRLIAGEPRVGRMLQAEKADISTKLLEAPVAERARTLAELNAQAAIHNVVCPPRASHRQCFVGLTSYQLATENGTLWTQWLQRLARNTSGLVALRIALEVRAEGCPTADDLASPRYTALRSPPVLGDSVRVTIGEATLTVRPPVWADDGKQSWTIHCP